MLHIEVGTGLIEHVYVYVLDASDTNDESLQFTSRKLTNLTFQNAFKLKFINDFVIYSFFIKPFQAFANNGLVDILRLSYGIHVLNFDKCLQIFFDQLLEEPLEFVSTEVFED